MHFYESSIIWAFTLLVVLVTVSILLLAIFYTREPVDYPFETVEKGYRYKILRHKETGVYYIVGDYNAMSVMLNPDGTAYTGG